MEIETVKKSLRDRLKTERRLTHQRDELASANTRIAEKARALSDEIIERRREAQAFRSEAETLKAQSREALRSLRRAKSEQVIAERRLWASLETIEDGFAVFDRERRMIASNRAFMQPFADMDCVRMGISYDDLIDIAAQEGLIDPGDRSPRNWAAWMKGRWDAGVIEPVTIRFWNNQFVRLTERRTEDGDMVVLGINITGTMRREKALEAARAAAEAASRAKSAFLANMSHEIRTPMNGVLAMADLLTEGALTEEQRLCVDTIRSSGEALLVIINDVLDYSKIEAGKLSLAPAPFDLEAAVHEVATLLAPAARDKGLSLVVDYDMFLPTEFEGDKGRLRQILMNLVGNAVKFTQSGHVLVRVVGFPGHIAEPYSVTITVEDTGIGIAADMKDHIFGEFNQAEEDSTRTFDGTGLGLAITERLVGLMGGEIWVESEPGQGSTFGFWLPLAPTGDTATGSDDLPTGGRKVFLFDPDRAARDVLAKQMMALGLRPESIAAPIGDVADRAGPGDLVVVSDSARHGGKVRLGLGPGTLRDPDAAIAVLPHPVLRARLMEALTRVLSEPVPQPPAATASAASAGAAALRVLAAEDNKTNQLVLKKFLQDQDIALTMVANGAELVEAYRAGPRPDIILTDISMPLMDGKDAAREIRRIESGEGGGRRTPIIAMTAHALEGDKADILAAGIDHYMAKPLKKSLLIELIDRARQPAGA